MEHSSAKYSFAKKASTFVAAILALGALLILFAGRPWSKSHSRSDNGIEVHGRMNGRCPI